jgi:hypothetical protein
MSKQPGNDPITDRAAAETQQVNQEAEQARHRTLSRERVLTRFWQIADLDIEKTRNSATAQMKALSMIVALEGLLPDRRTAAAEKKVDPPTFPNFYQSAWLREQKAREAAQASADTATDSPSQSAVTSEQVASSVPDPVAHAPKVETATAETSDLVSVPQPGLNAGISPSPYARVPDAAPDNRQPFRIAPNPFRPAWKRR